MTAPVSPQAVIEQLETSLEAQKAQLRDLAMMGTIITSIHEIEKVLSVVMDMGIRLVDGEVGMILIEKDGALKSQVSWGVDQEFLQTLEYKDGQDVTAYCFVEREAVLLTDLGLATASGLHVQSVIALPIKTSEKCLGVMVVINRAGGGNFQDGDCEVLEMLLNFVAVAIDNSNLMAEQLKQQKIKQEMAIARQVQETLLPHDLDTIEGAEVGAVYFPARDVGGDFYDIIKLDDRRFLAIIADVSNKGVPAAMVMAATSGIIKTIVERSPEIRVSELAAEVNDKLVRDIIRDREMFVTMFISKFDLDARSLTYCNAGHIPGLFWDTGGEQIVNLAEGGPIIGQFGGIAYTEGTHSISTGDRLFLFTDGLTEAEDQRGNLFGRERAEQVFIMENGLPPGEFCLRVKQWVDHFQENTAADSHDDFTIMQIRVGQP